MNAIRGNIAKYSSFTGADPTGLGRWNYVDIINNNSNLRIAIAYQSVRSDTTLGTIYLQ